MRSAAAPVAGPPLRTLSPLALELGYPALLESDTSLSALRPPRRYGRWLSLGALATSTIGLWLGFKRLKRGLAGSSA